MSAATVLPEPVDDHVRDLCANAVDPLEIAAGLEFGGLTDEGAARHGHSDVFAYAEALYRSVPRKPAEPSQETPVPWSGHPGRHAVRGILFGLPGLCYVTAAQAVTGPTAVLVVSLLLAWAYGQGAAYLAYVAIGHGDRDAGLAVARRALRVGLAVLAPVIVAVGMFTSASPAGIALALGQAAYLLAAGVILVADGELVLLAVLIPGCAVSAVHLVTGWPAPWAVWAAGALSVAEAVVLAEIVSRSPARPTGLRRLPGAVPPALFGALCGGLLAVSAPAQNGALVMVPLSLSMGAAEWAVFRFRRGGHLLLGRTATARRFGRAVRLELLGALGRYLAVLLVLTALAWLAVRPGAGETLRLAANLALGGAVLVALILQSCGISRPVLALFATALAAGLLTPGTPQIQLLAHVALLCALTGLAWPAVARTSLHI
ncbi:hypothetical protein Aph01nite_27400 [Acrocarpospora phusangensis]|uniref:Integral membrane protein n=1 Tax=Acrocarpospora phusangensis TaxID=1070424 RepID=A0A919QD77_9ACTN|nr:hypothetical protein [Acrocarpospora phusangensis]GIH24430.1 hypothetical protein Aph01nite_27400 [Acrocarpospora phusangensis]